MKRILFLILFFSNSIFLQGQVKNKIQEVIASDPFFKQLKETYKIVQGDEKETVPHFLDMTMQYPAKISPSVFRKEKERYYSLCKEYNSIIEDIVEEINQFEKIKDLREIPLYKYKERIDKIQVNFKSFFVDINKYHGEALLAAEIIINVYKVGRKLVEFMIDEKIETIKRIMAENLRSMKIIPIPWEPVEALVASGQASGNIEERTAKLGLNQIEHYKCLNIAPGATKQEIDAAYTKLSSDYSAEKSDTGNTEDVRNFFDQMYSSVEAAKKYFDSNPPKKQEFLIENKASVKEAQSNFGGGCSEMKGEFNGLLQAVEYMTKEQLVGKLQEILKKY